MLHKSPALMSTIEYKLADMGHEPAMKHPQSLMPGYGTVGIGTGKLDIPGKVRLAIPSALS